MRIALQLLPLLLGSLVAAEFDLAVVLERGGTAPPADSGPRLAAVPAGSAAATAGLAADERILVFDGWRVHDQAELDLVLAEIPRARESATLTVRGVDGGIRPVELVGLDHLPLGIIPVVEHADLAALCARLGVVVSAADAAGLGSVPARALDEIERWSASAPDARGMPWLAAFAADAAAVVRGDACAGDAPAIPVPYVARLDAFYRALAAWRAGGDRDPDWAACGVDALTYASWYPYPPDDALELGAPHLGDAHLRALIDQPLTQRRAAAFRYVSRDTGSATDSFIDQVKASLIDVDNHGGWPFRSALVFEPKRRAPIVAELRRRHEAAGDDQDIVAYAMIGPLMMDGGGEAVADLVRELASRSPYFAWRALGVARMAARMHGQQAALAAVEAAGAVEAPPAGHRFERFFSWCVERCPALSMQAGPLVYAAGRGRSQVFRTRPHLVALALLQRGHFLLEFADEREQLARIQNEAAWRLCTEPDFGDAEQCADAAEGLRVLLGRDCNAALKDTVAACFARIGDFDRALAWQRQAVAEVRAAGDDARELVAHERLFAARAPCIEGVAGGAPVESVVRDGAGAIRERGTLIAGTRNGWWRTLRADGSVISEKFHRDGRPIGLARWFDAAGVMRCEGRFAMDGSRVGRWRSFAADGTLLIEGHHLNDEQRCHLWRWYWPDGSLRIEGRFLRGKRNGPWIERDRTGTIVAETLFIEDDGRWNGPPAEPIEPPGEDIAPSDAASDF